MNASEHIWRQPRNSIESSAQMMGSAPIRRAIPIRTCVGCRVRADKSTLVRIVLETKDAAVEAALIIVDDSQTLAGRGAYIHRNAECLERSIRGGIARSFRRRVSGTVLQSFRLSFRVASSSDPHERHLNGDVVERIGCDHVAPSSEGQS